MKKKSLSQEELEAKLLTLPMPEVLRYLDELDAADNLILEAVKAKGSQQEIQAAEDEIALRKKERFEFMCLRMMSANPGIKKRKRSDAG